MEGWEGARLAQPRRGRAHARPRAHHLQAAVLWLSLIEQWGLGQKVAGLAPSQAPGSPLVLIGHMSLSGWWFGF